MCGGEGDAVLGDQPGGDLRGAGDLLESLDVELAFFGGFLDEGQAGAAELHELGRVVAGVGEDDPIGYQRVVLAESPRDAGEEGALAVLPGALPDGHDVVVRWVSGGGLADPDLHPIGDIVGECGDRLVPVGTGGEQVEVAARDLRDEQTWVVREQVPGAEVDDPVGAVEQVRVRVEEGGVAKHDAGGEITDRV